MDKHAVIVAGTSGVITEWNHAAEKLFGYRVEEAVGQSLDLVVPEPWQQAAWAGFHRAMKGPKGKAIPGNLPIRCADGKVRNFACRLLVLSDGWGVAIGAMAIFSNAPTTTIQNSDVGRRRPPLTSTAAHPVSPLTA
jgi:PAS domain S-box-containing protein